MAKLHELIAVESDLKERAKSERIELSKELAHAQNFVGEIRTYQPLEEFGEQYPDEVTNINLTAAELVKSFENAYSGWLNVSVQKELTNVNTAADVTVDENNLLFSDLPSPALLNLESKLAEIRGFYSDLPVLDMTEVWHFDPNNGVWVSEPRKTFKAKKVLRNHVKAEATKEHPAQVEVYSEDIRVGEWTKIVKSGAITARQKKEILSRIDALALAVKKARQRANEVIADTPDFATRIFEYINGDVF